LAGTFNFRQYENLPDPKSYHVHVGIDLGGKLREERIDDIGIGGLFRDARFVSGPRRSGSFFKLILPDFVREQKFANHSQRVYDTPWQTWIKVQP